MSHQFTGYVAAKTWALVKHLGRGAGYRRQELALAP